MSWWRAYGTVAEFSQDKDSFHAQFRPIIIVPDETSDLFLPKFGTESGDGARRFEGDTFFRFPADEVFECWNDLVTRIVAEAQGFHRGVAIYVSVGLQIVEWCVATWQISRQIGKGRRFAGENGGLRHEGVAGGTHRRTCRGSV